MNQIEESDARAGDDGEHDSDDGEAAIAARGPSASTTLPSAAPDAPPAGAPEPPARDPKEPDAQGRCTVEVWAAKVGTADWLFAAAKAGQRWAIGQEITEQQYSEAIEAAANVPCR